MNSVKLNRKHLFTFVLSFVLLFSFNLNTFAADATGDFSINDCTVICSTLSNSGVTTNVSNDVNIQDYSTGSYNGMRAYAFPSWSEGELRSSVKVRLVENFSVRADHEYNLKFRWSYNYGTQCNFTVSLRFLNASGVIIKSQTIYSIESPGNSKIYAFDLNFTPVVPEDEAGYKCDLYLEFNQVAHGGTTPQRFYISQTLSLIDLDDNSAQLDGILGAILSIPEKIKDFFEESYGGSVNTPDTGLGNASDELENAMGELPTLNQDEYDKLFDIDFSTFSNSLNFIRTQFDRIMDVSGMGTILTFTLAIGFAIYILGKKVG